MSEPIATGRQPATQARRRLGPLRRTLAGVVAIGAKDLRGRMRGRRAFLILTGYLLVLAAFALSTQASIADTYRTGFGGSAAFAGAAIGQGVFGAMLMLMTFLVVVLAPLATASSISLEREKQTLDLLMVTPIPSFAIVVGKLLSALAWVFLLIAASVPLMAIVFVYGGVGPDALISGYLVLIAVALGLGALGLLCSSVVKRTTVATALTIVGVLVVTFPTVTQLLSGPGVALGGVGDGSGRPAGLLGLPVPEAIVRLDPFVAQTDVMCGTETTFGGRWCAAVQTLVPTDGIIFGGGPVPVERGPVGPGGFVDDAGARPAIEGVALDGLIGVNAGGLVAPEPTQVFGPQRDALWPESVVTWLILSVVFLGLSVQFVSPTRRWRLRRGPRASARTTP